MYINFLVVSALFKCTFVVWFGLRKCFCFWLEEMVLLEEMSEIRRQMAAGRCFIIVGGWLKLLSM